MSLYSDSNTTRAGNDAGTSCRRGKRFFIWPDEVIMSTLMSCALSQAEAMSYDPFSPTYLAEGMQPIRMNTMFGLAHINDGEGFRQ